MRGCLTLIIGILLGVLILAATQILVVNPRPLPAPGPVTSDLVILFRNDYLTHQVQAQLEQTGTPISPKGLTVQAEPGQIVILSGTGVVNGVSLGIPIRVVLRPALANNRVTITIAEAQVGSLKLPGEWFKSFESQINDSLNRTMASSAFRVVGVSTTVEGLIVDVVVTR